MLNTTKKILILGGTGYIGQRVTHHLRHEGHQTRVMTRRPHMAKAWLPLTEIVTGDAMSGDDLLVAMRGMSHVVVCIRLWKTTTPKAYANMALTILHTANRANIQHLTWVSAHHPDMRPLQKILRSQKGSVQVFFLQSGPLWGRGSLAETAAARLTKYPQWLSHSHHGRNLVAIDQLLTPIARAISENKSGRIRMPSHNKHQIKEPPKKSLFTSIQSKVLKTLWRLATRLPHRLGPWLYLQMEGDFPEKTTFAPDTHITWQEALPEHPRTTWTAIPYLCTPKIQTLISHRFATKATPKPGQYHGQFRMIYRQDKTQVWQSEWTYPFGVRIVLEETPQLLILPAGALGWGLAKTGQWLWHMGLKIKR